MGRYLREIRCKQTGQIFESVFDAADTLKISDSAIRNTINGWAESCYGLSFEYTGNYRALAVENIDTGEFYNTIQEAADKNNTTYHKIYNICRNRRNNSEIGRMRFSRKRGYVRAN